MKRKSEEPNSNEEDLYSAIAAKLSCDMCELSSSISTCRKCGSRGGIPGCGAIGAEIFLLAGVPGPGAKPGNPWGGWRDDFMRRAGDELGWEREKVYLSTALRCVGKKPRVPDLRRCAPYLAEEISTVGARLLIVSGKVAAVGLRLALGDQVPENPKAGDSLRLFSSCILFNLDVSRIAREEEAQRIFWDLLKSAGQLLKS